ncbi:MAG TPA: HAD family hydrolase [Candidatus Eisenbacteria bacterium]|jgi:phosphoglycolate phosphatase-like HAD superfamily hydrolase
MASATTPLVWLFDIDGTLLLTQGAGREALSLALRDQIGVDDDLTGIPFGGRTDRLIVAEICERHGIAFPDGELTRFWDRAAFHMRRLMDPPRGSLLPGVSAMLEAVAAEPGWVCALLTGNVTEMARIKLSAFGVYERFAWGAFGDEAPDRDALARLAVRRAAERHGVTPEQCVVVGDTEHDIACARSAGARVVAVATGGRTRAELEALRADLVLDNFAQHAAMLRWAREL